MNGVKFLDIVLFPRSLYKRITSSKALLVPAIIFVGLNDMLFQVAAQDFGIFKNKPGNILLLNIALFTAFTVIVGLVDILFFSLPMFDLFKLFKRGARTFSDSGLLIKLIKVYVVSHFLIIPVEILITVVFKNPILSGNYTLVYFAGILGLFIPIWFSAAITRGINVLYDFEPLHKVLAFVSVFVWNILLSYFAFDYMLNNWVMKVFM